MENRFKLKISKLIQSTLNSCRPKTISDVYDHRINFPENPNHRRLIDLFSPKPQPLPSSSTTPKTHHYRLGTTPYPSHLLSRRQCSVSPVHEKTVKSYRRKKTHYRKRVNSTSFSSVTDNYYHSWWSSDEDDKSKNTLFFRLSFSSGAGEGDGGGGGGGDGDRRVRDAANVVTMDGFAVAKESSDPHEDFRVSMVDMIVEKGIFSVEELEKLVECFLELNSEEHHKVIFEVFAEIWETLIKDLYKRK